MKIRRKVPEGVERTHLNDKRIPPPEERKLIDLKCKFCGTMVTLNYWKIKTFKYCSADCREKAKRKVHKSMHWKQLKEVKYVDLTCHNPECKKNYRRTQKDFDRKVGYKYCSSECYHRNSHLLNVSKKIKEFEDSNKSTNQNSLDIFLQMNQKLNQ